ncbi:complement C1q tumor necrosis factor-related protein 3-like [Mytilus galloprovincialis]|uniref:complement C1q tumor necrosis factor-related protein 3-like n=1 Tax=Mytilus galloprovincialis TaxID=29158 RepID=UPI003F7C170F
MYAGLELKMETNYVFLKTKQNISAAEIKALVNEVKSIEEMVKTPDPVAFVAYRTRSQSLVNGTKVVFDKIWTNVGNGYQPSTGIFTAPRAGLYHLSAVAMSRNGNQLYVRLLHNGQSKSGSWVTGDGRKTGILNAVLSIQKGDEICIVAGNSETIYSDGNAYINFSGYTIK